MSKFPSRIRLVSHETITQVIKHVNKLINCFRFLCPFFISKKFRKDKEYKICINK